MADYHVQEPISSDEECYSKQPILTNGFIPPFVSKLLMMVNANSPMCYWGDTGKTVKVNQDENDCLNLYFKSNVVNSFIRQFNMYGFTKVSNNDNIGNIIEFKNDYFQRGREDLLHQIKRKKQKRNSLPKTPNVSKTESKFEVPLSRDIEKRLTKVEDDLENYKNKIDTMTSFMEAFLKSPNIKISPTYHKYDEEAIRKRGPVTFNINFEPRRRRISESYGSGSEGSPDSGIFTN
jgi:hypothetical protein